MADKEIGESLKQISANLETINKTLKEHKHEDKATTYAEDWKKRIENLIKKVNCECKRKSFTRHRIVSILVSVAIFLIIGILLAWLNLRVYNVISSSAIPSDQIPEYVVSYASLSISISALIIALASFLFPSLQKSSAEELANWYYDKLSKSVDVKDKPYLKALINMKCKEFDLSLWENYQNCVHLNCDLFTEESLLRNLLT